MAEERRGVAPRTTHRMPAVWRFCVTEMENTTQEAGSYSIGSWKNGIEGQTRKRVGGTTRPARVVSASVQDRAPPAPLDAPLSLQHLPAADSVTSEQAKGYINNETCEIVSPPPSVCR